MEPYLAGGLRSVYSSVSTLGRSQYPTLPLGASLSNGPWTPQYPFLARSPSAAGYSDSVFLDEAPDDSSTLPASPGRYRQDPTYSNGSQGDLETDGPPALQHHPHHLHHSLPRRCYGYSHNHALPEYVNQQMNVSRPAVPERPSTLPRKAARAERGLPNGLSSGHSVENPEYLVPTGSGSASPAFDNPYYLDLLAKVKAVGEAGTVGGDAENAGGETRQVNGFLASTAENPEYLGLADTWSGHT
ncbi:receptor tyrosine-protein kinase erbB-2-like [Lampris incognitus]|uniref:receptor tyrosine-protein kinase erbB-2-like n=1 Tax=Lampris incognitus TaxID=2546036 RepID=UPI0024B517B4|nr:receptor tyrosine-protein kinase erbB-2-like [Lampris incognitus]